MKPPSHLPSSLVEGMHGVFGAEPSGATRPDAAGQETLRGELEAMKLSAVKKRAKEAGVDTVLLDEADDAEDIKAAVIDLILAC